MSIDSGRSSLLFSSAQLCPISNVSFDDHIKAHFSHPMPRPYVLTVVQVAPGMHYFTDAISLVQSKCTYEKVYCYVLRNSHAELFEPFAAVDGQLSEDFGQLLVAFSPDPSEEVDAARREVICKRSHQDGVIEELCRRVLHDHPDDCEVLSELGDLLRAKGAFDLAAHYLEQAIQKGEDSAFSLASLALVHHAKGEKVRTCSLLLQAREREPENEGIGRVIEKVIQEDPLVGGILKRYACALDDYTIHLLLAELASQIGHHQEARRYLYQAIESNPEIWTAYAMYANVLRKIAEPELLQLAETLLRHVIDCKVESAFVYARLGDVYRLQKNESMAVWAFRCAVEIDERDAFAWKGLGVIAEQTGSYSEAADFYKRVLHIKPKWAEMHVALGRALLHLDEEGQAAEAFRSALVHDAANREAEKGLAVVQQKLADDAFVESLLVE